MASPAPPSMRIRFGAFELDATSGELRKNGILLRLQPQPFRVLLLLIERAGQVVTRGKIQRCLWRDSTFVDFEHGINFSINQIRGALADSAEDPRYVETLPRRGYRFSGTVEQNLVAKLPESSARDRDESVPTRRRGWNSGSETAPAQHWLSAVALVLFAAAFAVAAYLLFHRVSPVGGIKQRRLTANPSSMPVDRAVISPDGKYLAYSDHSGIHLQLIGANETRTLESPPGFSPRQASLYPTAWFPSGTRLLLNTVLAGQRSIWVSSILGGAPVKLRDDAAGQSVSPDGSLIAFTANSTQIGDREIWLMAPDGEDAHKLVTVDEHSGVGRVVWSPDGQRFAYQRFHWEADKFQVSVESCDLNGTQPSVLLSDPALIDFWWGPEGRLIYSRSEPQPNEKNSNLWDIRIDPRTAKRAGEPRRITNWADFSFQDLTGTSDGRRLSTMKKSVQSDVHIGILERTGEGLKSVRRLTLDEHDDWPFGFTPDSKVVVFSSNRNGPVGIFKQSLDQDFAETISIGSGDAVHPTLSPDGLWILYAATPKAEGSSYSVRLMRVPLTGGVPQEILKTRGYSNHDCGRFPGTLCVLAELTEREIVFWAFDPVQGERRELTRISVSPSKAYDMAVAPDGSHIAVTRYFDPEGRIRILSSTGEPERDVVVKGWGGFGGVNWQADGRGFFVSSQSPRVASLLHVSMDGRAQVLWEQEGSGALYGVSSPNGRYLAFAGSTSNSNVWLIENF
jgi:Tol biopolymer transport system component/DNA-binding winged helix-turn-helix (wHTH) protein